MKKILVIALAVVMMVSALALVACGGDVEAKTYTGECKYSAWEHIYGVKVDVTVVGDKIAAVELWDDVETEWIRTSADNGTTWTSHDKVEKAYRAWIKSTFVGKTVEEVLAYNSHLTIADDAATFAQDADSKYLLAAESYNIAGATQSVARVIYAVQNALKTIEA